MDEISVDHSDSRLAELAIKTKADHMFRKGDHLMAELEYARLIREHPQSRYHQFALRRGAEAALASYGGVDYDEAALIEAEERYREGEWVQAAELYEQVLALEPGYRDVEAKLVEAQRQQHLADQYAQALEHLQAQRWQEAIEGFKAVVEVDPAYKDAATLLTEARHQKELASLPKPPGAKPPTPRRRKPTSLPR